MYWALNWFVILLLDNSTGNFRKPGGSLLLHLCFCGNYQGSVREVVVVKGKPCVGASACLGTADTSLDFPTCEIDFMIMISSAKHFKIL